MRDRAKQLVGWQFVLGMALCGASLGACDEAVSTADVGDTAVAADTSDTSEEVLVPVLAVVVNEVAPAGAPDDWVELFNAGETRADLGGWALRDEDPRHGFVLPAGTSIAPRGYLVVGRGVTEGVVGFDFGLGAADGIFLFDAAGRLADGTSWDDGAAPAGASWGRIPDGSGGFVTLETPSRGARNVENRTNTCGDQVAALSERCDGEDFHGATCASFGWGSGALACVSECKLVSQAGCVERAPGLVINEVESDGTDRVELYNGSDEVVDLAGYALVDAAGNTFIMPNGSSIVAKGYLVLERDVDHLFGLGGQDGVALLDRDGARVDGISWVDGEAVPSLCRAPSGVGGFRHCESESFGAANP